MKKIFTAVVAIAMAVAFTMPAMAETKVSFKGEYRVRGFMHSNPSLQADQAQVKGTGSNASQTLPIAKTGEGPSQSWMDMRFRLQTTFKASDRLSVVTRFDALDGKKWGHTDNDLTGTGVCPDRNNNIDFDRAYMVIKADFGTFKIGRQSGGTYGTDFLDTGKERDRVRFDYKMDNWIFSAIYQKKAEGDSDDCKGTDILADNDEDWYYAVATYKSEDLDGGVELAYANNKNKSDNIDYDPTGGFGTIAEDDTPTYDREMWSLNPYFDATFGDFGIMGEGQILFGKYKEWDRDCYIKGMNNKDAARKAMGLGPQPDVDYDAYAWNLEGTWKSGPFSAQLGYVFVKGEDDPYDDKMETVGGIGDDWGKVFILTNTDNGIDGDLGGHAGAGAAGADAGNLAGGSTAAENGCKMVYLGGSFSPMENLKISALFANSKSESPGFVDLGNVPAKSRRFASDHGSEYDLTVDWNIYDNLSYKFIAAYLDAGDYWQFGNPYRELENTWCFWQQLKLKF